MDSKLSEQFNEAYEKVFFAHTSSLSNMLSTLGFYNMGYWKGIDESVECAQINLIETLVSFFRKRDGNILDVACGAGASSRFLTKYFDAKRITGINIADKQLEVCKLVAPGCEFKLMDAAKLEFNDSSFDNVLCIEAALHFITRRRFFEQTHRVLKPDGRFASLDFLCNYDALDESSTGVLPKTNYLPSVGAYKEMLLDVGFRYVRVDDCTELTITPLTRYLTRVAEGGPGKAQDYRLLEDIEIYRKTILAGCLVFAIK